MEIKRTDRIESATVRKSAKAGTGSGGQTFAISGGASGAGASSHAQTGAALGPIGSIDTILTLQGLDDSTSGRAKGVSHGEQLLDMLDEVRDGLLAGGVPRATLNRLANAVGHRHDNFADPKLQGVLDEIELRARVELAKLEQADTRTA